MSNKITYLFIIILAMGSCSKEQESQAPQDDNDFDVFCSKFMELTQQASYKTLSSEERGAKLETMLIEELEPNSDAYLAWSAIRNAPPAERYRLYKEAAASTGYNDWQCRALEQHSHEVGSRHE